MTPSSTHGKLTATDLRCEHARDPLGVDQQYPVLSWVPVSDRRAERQTAYRIQVTHDRGSLFGDDAYYWDSGRVATVESVISTIYDGRPLASRDRCWWTVQLWDRNGEAGPPSKPGFFEMGLMHQRDWRASWIGHEASEVAPLMRREFVVPPQFRSARAYVTSLGFYELHLNGAKVGDRQRDPAVTTYATTPTSDTDGPAARNGLGRILYSVFDVTEQIRIGSNAVGLMLGNGWHAGGDDYLRSRIGDQPLGFVQIEIELDDSKLLVVSDDSWRTAPGPITHNDIINGEHYDARLECEHWDCAGFDDSSWSRAVSFEPSESRLRSQLMEPIRVVEKLAPVTVATPRDGVAIVDFGQHVSGWTKITAAGPAGAEVVLRHGSELDDVGELDLAANLGMEQKDVITLKDGLNVWEPRFTWHGFRYVEVLTPAETTIEGIEAQVVHSDLATSGRFECADQLLNRIDQNVRWTFRASFQGIPQDAADRHERVAWLGDAGWIVEDSLYCFDAYAFWAKWLDDILDLQLPDGRIPVIAPARCLDSGY